MRLFVTGCLVVLCACGRENLASSSPVIDVQPLALDFGPVPVGLTVTLPVQVRNPGRAKLVIQPTAVAGDFAANDATLELEPGETGSLDFAFTPSTDGVRDATLHLLNNSYNDTDVAFPVTGLGTPRTICTECNTPPADYCASSSTLIQYQPQGSCVGNKCEYQARTVICGGMCVASTMACSMPMGTDAGVDAGVVDAGVIDAGVEDAGTVFTMPGVHQWTVPTGVTQLTVKAWGGGGAGGAQSGAFGGGGAFARATLAVVPGETLELQVAEGGVAPGNGAGATLVLRGTTALVIAAGGGGGGSDGCGGTCRTNEGGAGGAGGGLTGQDGENFLGTIATFCTGATGGRGGTSTAGGVGGVPSGSAANQCTGRPGDSLTGGRATGVNGSCDMTAGATGWQQGGGQGNGGGGGGGAGLFGGGGAGFIWTYCSGGGGGGSSFAVATATAVQLVGGNLQAQGNVAESSGAGRGGDDGVTPVTPGMNGAGGRVELIF